MKMNYYQLKVTIAMCLLLLITSCKEDTYKTIDSQEASIVEVTSHGKYLVNLMGAIIMVCICLSGTEFNSSQSGSSLSLWDVFGYLARNAIPRHLENSGSFQ